VFCLIEGREGRLIEGRLIEGRLIEGRLIEGRESLFIFGREKDDLVLDLDLKILVVLRGGGGGGGSWILIFRFASFIASRTRFRTLRDSVRAACVILGDEDEDEGEVLGLFLSLLLRLKGFLM